MPKRLLPAIAASVPGQPRPIPASKPVNPNVLNVQPDPNYIPDPNYVPVESSYIPDEYLPDSDHNAENAGDHSRSRGQDFDALSQKFEKHGVQLEDDASSRDIVNALKKYRMTESRWTRTARLGTSCRS